MKKNAQTGFGLIETLLVIGIIAILSYAAFDTYRSVKSRQEAVTEQKLIMSVLASAQKVAKGNFRGLYNLQLNREEAIPYSWNGGDRNTASLNNQWNGAVNLSPTDGSENECPETKPVCPGLKFETHEIPQQVCLALVPFLQASFRHIEVKPENKTTWLIISKANPSMDYSTKTMIQACNQSKTLTIKLAT